MVEANLGERIAVIGAGISGLTAAYTLRQQGHCPVVFEASDYVGGRIKSFRRNDFLYDVGAFIYLGSYSDALALMKEVGLESELGKFGAYGAMPRGGELHYLNMSQPLKTALTSKYISVGSKAKLLKLGAFLARNWKHLNYSDASGLATIDNDTVESFCKRELNAEIYHYIASVVIRGPWLSDPSQASIGQLLWTLKNFFKPHFYGLDSGMDALPRALAAQLDVRLNTPIMKVEKHVNKVIVESPDGSEQFDRAVITTTAPSALSLYPQMNGKARELYQNTNYICSVNTHIALSKCPENKATYIMASPKENVDFCGVIVDHLKANSRVPAGKGMLTAFCRHEWCLENLHTTNEEVLDKVLAMLEPYYGDLSNDVEDYEIGRWTEVVPIIPKGRFKAVAAYQRSIDPKDRVQLAGDIAPMGGVNAALVSGRNVAERMMAKV